LLVSRQNNRFNRCTSGLLYQECDLILRLATFDVSPTIPYATSLQHYASILFTLC
jgi:hypothetical protein